MKKRITNLLSMCMQAKEKGFDCFFEYQPHTLCVSIRIFETGWAITASTDKHFYFYLDEVRGQQDTTELRKAETYLKGLIEDGKPEID